MARLTEAEWEWWIGSLVVVGQHVAMTGLLLASLVGAGLVALVGYWEEGDGSFTRLFHWR